MTLDQWLADHSEQTVLVPKGTIVGARAVTATGEPCHRWADGAHYENIVLQADTLVVIGIDASHTWDLVKRGLRNKGRRAKQGPMTARRIR